MRKFENGLKVIGTDLGYGNIKTANTVMPTGLTIYDTEPIFQGNTLEYNGNYYRVGENHKEFIADKSVDASFLHIRTLWQLLASYNAQERILQVFILRQAYLLLGYAHNVTVSKRIL